MAQELKTKRNNVVSTRLTLDEINALDELCTVIRSTRSRYMRKVLKGKLNRKMF
jgi:hypothetical protein